MSGAEVFEVPVHADYEGLRRCWEVHVPTERGETCEVCVTWDIHRDVLEVDIAGALLRQSSETVTAALGMALLTLRSHLPPSIERL